MKSHLSALILASLFIFSACTKAKDSSGGSDSKGQNKTTAQTAAQAPNSATSTSPNCAVNLQVNITGQCVGVWKYVRANNPGQSRCDFIWSPVTCENRGHKPDKQNYCYGVFSKNLESGSEGQCGEKFGVPPQVANYNFSCCPK